MSYDKNNFVFEKTHQNIRNLWNQHRYFHIDVFDIWFLFRL